MEDKSCFVRKSALAFLICVSRIMIPCKGLKEIFGDEFKTLAKEQIILIREVSGHIEGINSKVEAMTNERKKANNLKDAQDRKKIYANLKRQHKEFDIGDHVYL